MVYCTYTGYLNQILFTTVANMGLRTTLIQIEVSKFFQKYNNKVILEMQKKKQKKNEDPSFQSFLFKLRKFYFYRSKGVKTLDQDTYRRPKS